MTSLKRFSLHLITIITVLSMNLTALAKPHNPNQLFEFPQQQNDSKVNMQKTLRITVKELTDNQGLKYIGALVPAAELATYLEKMQDILTDDFAVYRQNQASRDHQLFHVTIINPNEYQYIDANKIKLGEQFTIYLKGLGRVSDQDNAAYFVVVESTEGQFYRQKHILKSKDFHITLGFKHKDIYHQKKDLSSLIP